MSILNEFIEHNDVLSTKNLLNINEIKEIEKELSVNIGEQLKEYIIKYGFLAFEHVELYGVNSKQKMNSDMVKCTKILHKDFPITKKLVVLENRGDDDYILVDNDDNIFEFEANISNELININKKMFNYIFDRFMECKA